MIRSILFACLLGVTFGARAEPWAGPIFDAHLHYNDDAQPRYSPAAVFELFRKNGVGAILANSRPNDGTRTLHEAARASSTGVAVVPSSASIATATTTEPGSAIPRSCG